MLCPSFRLSVRQCSIESAKHIIAQPTPRDSPELYPYIIVLPDVLHNTSHMWSLYKDSVDKNEETAFSSVLRWMPSSESS